MDILYFTNLISYFLLPCTRVWALQRKSSCRFCCMLLASNGAWHICPIIIYWVNQPHLWKLHLTLPFSHLFLRLFPRAEFSGRIFGYFDFCCLVPCCFAACTIKVSRYLERRQMVSGQYLTNHLEYFVYMRTIWFTSEFVRNDSLLEVMYWMFYLRFLNLYNKSMRSLLVSKSCRWENQGTDWLRKLKFTQVISVHLGHQLLTCWLPGSCINH